MKQTDSKTLVFECDLPEPRAKVWRALTEKELLAAWLSPNDIRPEAGAKFKLEPVRAVSEARAVSDACEGCKSLAGGNATECEVLEAEPGRTLRWRQREPNDATSPPQWIESVVSFELADLPDGGTHLRVVHDGFRAVTRTATVLHFKTQTPTATRMQATSLLRAA
jgi:uncharacterized protein YndB with AHSA1/START domain